MNTLSLRFLFDSVEGNEEEGGVMHTLLTVDGQHLDDDEGTDMLHLDELVGSIYGYGSFEIYTCGCGIAQCAGIWEDIWVDQQGDSVLWTIPQPLRQGTDGQTTYRHFVFDRERYRQAIQTGLDEAIKLANDHPGKISIGPSGFTIEELSKLSTERPDEVVDRRHTGKREVFVYYGPALVENCFICRIVEEKRDGKGFGFWVEGWTGSGWTRNVSIGMNTVEEAPLASVEILMEAGVPDEPFPPGYRLRDLAKNRWGL